MFKSIILLVIFPLFILSNLSKKPDVPLNIEPVLVQNIEEKTNFPLKPQEEEPKKEEKQKEPVKPTNEVTSENAVKSTTDPINTTPISTPKLETANFEEINTFAREATVNILCQTKGNDLSPISGTGIVIDPRGIILTNAHIGQYLLLKNFRQKDFVECVIRTGSPAYPTYNVELVYISPDWVKANKDLLKQTEPKGTGEKDFAFLRITGKINGNAMSDISFVPINIREDINKTEPVLLSSYPAGFLGGISILHDLNITTAITTVAEIYTFGENTIDLISVPGTVVSQKGSSGGAVVDENKTLIGIISTSSNGKTTSERNLYAITGAYINRSLQDELGITLPQFLNQDMSIFAKQFGETVAGTLTKIITDELLKN